MKLREAAQQALEAMDDLHRTGDTQVFDLCHRETTEALRAALAEPVQEPVECEPQEAVTEDGWCEWVCPKPRGYLMQCCGCGLIHEVESRVARYQPRPSEEFEVVDDPDLQVQWRMKRRDDIAPRRPEEPGQEPVAWRFEARHIDSAWAAAVTLKHPGPEGVYMRNVVPLYTAPPQRKPLTDDEVAALFNKLVHEKPAWPERRYRDFARYVERAHGICNE